MKFEPGGPPRFLHQRRGLDKMIRTGGVCALLMDPGCISGDAELTVNRGGKNFTITMRDLAKMQNGGVRSGNVWDLSIPTMVQREVAGVVRLGRLERAWSSGIKTTYTVTTFGGRVISATDEHPFLTDQGWKRLDELQPGDRVHVRGDQTTNNPLQDKPMYRDNLEVLKSQAEHNAVHGVTSRVLFKVVADEVVSIEKYGEEETFDIEVVDDPHNFIVNEFVVHNTGKTAVVLDYAGLLALKSPRGEVKILVVCPLVAVDTWVLQAEKFMSPQVNWWAEALGGALLERAEALASRGGNPYKNSFWPNARAVPGAPRALHHDKHWAWKARATDRSTAISASEGPDGLGSGRPRVVLEIINIDTLQYRTAVGRQTMADVMVDAIKRYAPDLLVVDESHRIKGAQANASRLLGRLAKSVRRRVILTGTVMPHSPLDVFGQWRFLEPYAFGDLQSDGSHRQATWTGFKGRYAIEGGWMGKEVTGFRDLDDMQNIMAKNAIVARKTEVLDLPSTTDVVIPVELSPAEKKAYAEMKDQLATELANGALSSVPNRLTQMLRLRQITSGHLPDDTGKVLVIGRSKIDTIKSLIQDTLLGEQRIVVFAYFSVEIAMLADVLAAKGTEVLVITGGTSGEDRQIMRKRFGSNEKTRMVMVAQVKTMSLAVNELVTASHAIFASMSQQRDDLIQARDRLDRIGQTKPVTFWYCNAPGTIDEVILRAHNDRTSLEDALLAHIQEKGS